MPRVDKGLRTSYLLRQIVEGDCPYTDSRESETELSPTLQKAKFYPINPYHRERIKDYGTSRRKFTSHGMRSSSSEHLKSSRRIRWNQSGDSIRTYSPEYLRPHSVDYLSKEKRINSSKKNIGKRPESLVRKSRSEDKMRKEEEVRTKREISAERKKTELMKLRQEEKRRRSRNNTAKQRDSRENNNFAGFYRKTETSKATSNRKLMKSYSNGNLNNSKDNNNKIKRKSLNRSNSISDIYFQKPKHSNITKVKKPVWNYVGDPTRKAFNTKSHHLKSDFYF